MATYLYEHVAVWSSCALVVQGLSVRSLVPTRLAEAAIQRRSAALQLNALAEWWRARGRRRRERPFASLLSVAAKALGLLARPLIAPGQARCHCGTYAVDERRSGGPREARCAGSALSWSGCNYGPCKETLTLRVAHVRLHMYACNHGARTVHSQTAVTVDLTSTNLSSIGWGLALRVLGRARRAGCALR